MTAGSITQRIRVSPGVAAKIVADRILELTTQAKDSLRHAEVMAIRHPDATLKSYNFRQVVELVIKGAVGQRLRQMLLRNYQRSNLGTFTPAYRKNKRPHGWLRELLARVTVYPVYRFAARQGAGEFPLSGIGYRMPRGYEDEYEAAAALNYGSVHTGKAMQTSTDVATGKHQGSTYRSLLGRDAKRSLKKFAISGKITKRSRSKIQNDYSTRMQGVVRKGVTVYQKPRQFGERTLAVGQIGGKPRGEAGRTAWGPGGRTIWTTKAFPFWELDQSQIQELNQVFADALKRELVYFGR